MPKYFRTLLMVSNFSNKIENIENDHNFFSFCIVCKLHNSYFAVFVYLVIVVILFYFLIVHTTGTFLNKKTRNIHHNSFWTMFPYTAKYTESESDIRNNNIVQITTMPHCFRKILMVLKCSNKNRKYRTRSKQNNILFCILCK